MVINENNSWDMFHEILIRIHCVSCDTIMNLEFLVKPKVWQILKELLWGDRFEDDLKDKIRDIKLDDGLDFEMISERLVVERIVYRLRGEGGSPYLALTDYGQALAGRLSDLEEILAKQNADDNKSSK
ncbi:MAG: hypothetical protein ACW97A_09030 [Candidatus Thorarchaeota archaeon]|jgi:hypothetical protein